MKKGAENKKTVLEDKTEILKAEEKAKKLEQEGKNYLEDLQRMQAEFENYIKRVEKEREQVKLNSKSELLLKFIRIKEDLEKSLGVVKDKGIEMIHNQMKKILEEEDVKEIETIGKKFDHNLHEVVRVIENMEDKIIEEVQKGYLIGDKILKIAKVVIGGKNE